MSARPPDARRPQSPFQTTLGRLLQALRDHFLAGDHSLQSRAALDRIGDYCIHLHMLHARSTLDHRSLRGT